MRPRVPSAVPRVSHAIRCLARTGNTIVTTNTEKIMPFNRAIHRVIGGNKQKSNIQTLSPGMLLDDEP